MGLTSGLFASAFYLITGFHALHVVAAFDPRLGHAAARAARRRRQRVSRWRRCSGTSSTSPGWRSSRSSTSCRCAEWTLEQVRGARGVCRGRSWCWWR